jgi:phosphate starvation-inducible PhoH-like protein
MPDTTPSTPRVERVISKIVVPAEQSMVTLLGNRDEVLRTVERVLTSDVHVRGNEITLTGKASDNALGVLLFEQLLELLAKGETLTADSSSAAPPCSSRTASRPTC